MNEKEFLLREKFGGVKTAEFEDDCVRLDAGEPLAYVIGWVPFLGCRIYLDSRPIIPRPETAFWPEQALENIKTNTTLYGGLGTGIRILDLFAGSGAVGVAVLKHVPDATVDFGEIEEAHFPTIERNISENGIDAKRARIIRTDVWSGITDTYDCILANPPYISRERAGRVQDSVLTHEPHVALFSDNDGFALIEKTVLNAKKHLTPSGLMYIEHEPEQADMLRKKAEASGFRVEQRNDQYGVRRYSVLSVMA